MARVLVAGDTHCPAMHRNYPRFLEDIWNAWSCDTFVHIGDLADFSAISFHERHPSWLSAQEEIDLAMGQIQELYGLFSKGHVLVGNHDALPERQARTAGMPSDLLLPFEELWQTPKWTYVPQYGRIKIDGVIYQHGDRGRQGQRAAINNAYDNFAPVVQGHLHSQCYVSWHANDDHRFFAAQTGCGIDYDLLAFEYGRKLNQNPVLGCCVVLDGKHAVTEIMPMEDYK